MAATGTQHFRTLDAMRGAAALAVVLMHWSKLGGANPLPGAYLAVDLFFMLSGFVIAHAYDARLGAGLRTGRFMAVRLIRLYPLYLLGTLTSVALVITGIDPDWSRIGLLKALAWALPMLPQPPWADGLDDHGTLYPLNDPAWSLLFELLVNLLFAAVHRWLNLRALVAWVLAALVLLVLAVADAGSLERGWAWEGFAVGAARVGFSFPLGVLLYRLYRAGRLPAWKLPGIWVVAAMLALLALPPMADALQGWRDIGLVVVLLPPLVIAGIDATPPPLADWLGLISYPVYVLHGPIMGLLYGFGGVDVPFIWRALAFVVLVLVCAPLARRFDAPMRRRLSGLVLR